MRKRRGYFVRVTSRAFESYVRSDELGALQETLLEALGNYGVVIDSTKMWVSSVSPMKRFVANGTLGSVGVGVEWKIRHRGGRRKETDIGMTAERLRKLVVDVLQKLIALGYAPRGFEDIDSLHRHIREFVSQQGYRCPHTLIFWGRQRWDIPGEVGWEEYLERSHSNLYRELTTAWNAIEQPSATPS